MMDFMTHFPRTSRGHDGMWVIVDRLTKLVHFLAVWMTFTLKKFCRLYIRGDCLVAWGTNIDSIGSGSQVHGSFLEKFLTSHWYTVDDEHFFSSPDGQSVEEYHPDFRGHVMGMHP